MNAYGKILLGAVLASTATLGAAHAEATFSGNVALTSDYVFRGISQSDEDGAIQGGFDYGNGIFYAGVWGSSIDFGLDGTLEADLYAGVKPTLGPVTFDLGAIYYWYPGLDDDGGVEADMLEFKAGASFAPTEKLSVSGVVFYSPDFTFTVGDEAGLYAEAGVGYTVSDSLTISAAVGNQSVDISDYYGDTDNYTTWNLGGTYSAYGFGFDVRYIGTDFEDVALADDRVVFTLKRAL